MDDLESIAENAFDNQEQEPNENSEQDNAPADNQEADPGENNQPAENTEDEKSENDKADGGENKEKPDEDKEADAEEKFMEEARKRGFVKPDELQRQQQEEQKRQQTIQSINERPNEVDEETWKSMPPANKLIYKSLPYIETQGADGKIYKVKDSSQLPDGFEFADKKTELRFVNELNAQEQRAAERIQALQNAQQSNQEQAQQQQQARMVVNDVAQLQKDGVIPQIKAQPNTKEFDDDPGVKLVNEIIGFQQQRIQEGRPLSVYDAAYVYRGLHPEKFETKKSEPSKADVERKNVSKMIGGSDGGSRKDGNVRPNFSGMSAEDIADYYSDILD